MFPGDLRQIVSAGHVHTKEGDRIEVASAGLLRRFTIVGVGGKVSRWMTNRRMSLMICCPA